MVVNRRQFAAHTLTISAGQVSKYYVADAIGCLAVLAQTDHLDIEETTEHVLLQSSRLTSNQRNTHTPVAAT